MFSVCLSSSFPEDVGEDLGSEQEEAITAKMSDFQGNWTQDGGMMKGLFIQNEKRFCIV